MNSNRLDYLKKIQKHFLSFSIIMGILFLGMFLNRYHSYFLFHSVYAIFLLFIAGVFGITYLGFYMEENLNSWDSRFNLSLYLFALAFSINMGIFTVLYYNNTMPQGLSTVRNILLIVVIIDVVGLSWLAIRERKILTWDKQLVETKEDERAEAYPRNLDGILKYMDDKAHLAQKESLAYFIHRMGKAKDYAIISAIFTFAALIPFIMQSGRYQYSIDLFIVQYGLLLLVTVFFASFMYFQMTFIIAKHTLNLLNFFGEHDDNIYSFLGCIHTKATRKAYMKREVYGYIRGTALILLPLTMLYFRGIIPQALGILRLIILFILIVIVYVYNKKNKIQKDYLEHLELIGEIELKYRYQIEEMSYKDQQTFVRIYFPLLEGRDEVEYSKLTTKKSST